MKRLAFYVSLVLWVLVIFTDMDMVLHPSRGIVMLTMLGVTIAYSCLLVGTYGALVYDE